MSIEAEHRWWLLVKCFKLLLDLVEVVIFLLDGSRALLL